MAESSPPTDPTAGMVRIPAGPFLYGTTEEQFAAYLTGSVVNFPGMKEAMRARFEIPPRQVELPAFWIDEFEVTNRQFAEFLRATGYRPEQEDDYLEHWSSRSGPPDWAEEFPVVWVSEADAKAFCAWRQARLPTEQEWEKAARGEAGDYYPWGSSPPNRDTLNVSTGEIEPVGNRPEDRSSYQVYDLGGNVREWTSSLFQTDKAVQIVVRGGSFSSGFKDALSFARSTVTPQTRSENLGFRCARNLTGDDQ